MESPAGFRVSLFDQQLSANPLQLSAISLYEYIFRFFEMHKRKLGSYAHNTRIDDAVK